MKALSRDLKRAGLDGNIVYVSEYQESREAKYGTRVLHLHLLFCARGLQRRWAYDCQHYRRRWSEALIAVLGDAARNASFESSENIEGIRKSAGSYLGKYMSKGSTSADGGSSDQGADDHPRAWHGISRDLLRKVVSNIREWFGSAAKERISFLLDDPTVHMRFNRWVSIPGEGGRTLYIAWYGDLADPCNPVFAKNC